ncbi:hypothetical protein BJX61DRAFT_307736 [Aspergillus egyptiacus]|nr:hypothetical protein BJX61DRAFT_307736 [Aspergillus egyptiacus]
MHSLRRAASRLLSTPAPIPIRSKLTAVSNTHRLACCHRTFTQTRWFGDEARSPSGPMDSATTSTTPTTTNDAPDSIESEKEPEDRLDAAATESATVLATDVATSTTISDAPHPLPDAEADHLRGDSEQDLSEDRSADEGTPRYRHLSMEDIDYSQIRDAVGEEAQYEKSQAEKKAEKMDLIRRARYTPKDTIFIGNLFYDVTAEDLKAQMSKYGTVEEVNVLYDSRGISKGFAYVQFDSPSAARRAIAAMHMRIYEGRRVTVYYAYASLKKSTRQGKPTNTVYVGNMPFQITDAELTEFISDIVNVVDVRVSVDRQTGQFRGYVHVEFLDVQSAMAGFEKMAKKVLHGRKLTVEWSYTKRTARANLFPVAA